MRALAKTRLDVTKPVAGELARRVLGGDRPLPVLCGWNAARYADNGEVAYWRDELLRDGADLLPETHAHTARTALAGGVAAWAVIASREDGGWRADARHRLAARMRTLLPLCRPAGRRGGDELSGPDVDAAESALTSVLFGEALQAES